MERFRSMFKTLPSQVKRFDPDAFVREVNAHIETSGLRPEGGREKEPGYAVVNVLNRPAYDKYRFVIDPRTANDKRPVCYAVPNESALQKLLGDGYVQVTMTALDPNDWRTYPPKIPASDRLPSTEGGRVPAQTGASQTGVRSAAQEAGGSNPPEKVVRVPKDLPPFDQRSSAPTRAEQLVEWMEVSDALPCA